MDNACVNSINISSGIPGKYTNSLRQKLVVLKSMNKKKFTSQEKSKLKIIEENIKNTDMDLQGLLGDIYNHSSNSPRLKIQ